MIVPILGLFGYTLTTSLAAFFIRINIEYYILIFLINIVSIYFFRKDIKQHLYRLAHIFKTLKLEYKTLYLLLFILILIQSSTKPYLIDNETYYIQTIKWLNEYGYVRGLANLHIFLGQNSAWHALQSGFNFSFLSHNDLNDINGFLFCVFNLLAIEKLNAYRLNKHIQSFCLGLTLLFTLFFMQFVNTPSPDLIIFLMSQYLFYTFIVKYNTVNTSDFKIILSLVAFLCFIKVTIVVLAILPLALFIKNYRVLKQSFKAYLVLGIITLSLFVTKNTIISGYLFYPMVQLNLFDFDWRVPKTILEFYHLGTYLEGMSQIDVSGLSFIEKVKLWLSLPKLDGLFNKIFIVLLIIYPFIIIRKKKWFSFSMLYLAGILQLVLLWFTSPQYRFFFIFLCFFAIQVFVVIIKKAKVALVLIYISVILSAIPLFVKIDLNTFTKNKFAMALSKFKLDNIILPEKNSKTITEFTLHHINNFEFYSPGDDVFFWATGNGDLPCVNKKQINYFYEYFKYSPQLRTGNLKDGFKSVNVVEK